jgi:protein-disulfide isomerase
MTGFSPLRSVIAAILAAWMILVPGLSSNAEEPLTDAQRAAVEALIEQYIQENPGRILESVRNYREREEARIAGEQQTNLNDLKHEILFDPDSPVAGNPEGSVTVVEFFDYRCGYCKASLEMVMDLIREDPDIRVVFKELPILSPESARAAQAALAAQRQGRYLDLHYAMMSSRGQYDDQQILDIAAEVGLDVEQLAADMDAPEIKAFIQNNLSLAGSLGIDGTPTFIVDDQIFRGAIDADTMRRAIAEARAG